MALLPFRPTRAKRFERLVQTHLRVMYNFAYRLTGQSHDAEDLVQDVMVKLYPRLDELEAVEQLRPWLQRVLYRHFIDQTRKKSRQADRPISDVVALDAQADFLDNVDAETPDLLEQLSRNRLQPFLQEVLGELSPDQRTLLLLHDADGWRQEDIAAVLDVPVGTVKSRLHRCRSALRHRLQNKSELFSTSERVMK